MEELRKKLSQAVKGRKEVGSVLKGLSKSDIERAEGTRNKYRADIDNLIRAEKKER